MEKRKNKQSKSPKRNPDKGTRTLKKIMEHTKKSLIPYKHFITWKLSKGKTNPSSHVSTKNSDVFTNFEYHRHISIPHNPHPPIGIHTYQQTTRENNTDKHLKKHQ